MEQSNFTPDSNFLVFDEVTSTMDKVRLLNSRESFASYNFLRQEKSLKQTQTWKRLLSSQKVKQLDEELVAELGNPHLETYSLQ